jgi:hypothetical protein
MDSTAKEEGPDPTDIVQDLDRIDQITGTRQLRAKGQFGISP